MKWLIFCLLYVSCSFGNRVPYQASQDMLKAPSSFYLDICVDAKHFDYSHGAAFLRSYFDRDDMSFGHAWMRLYGKKNETAVHIEGGHSGEISDFLPRYLDQLIAAAKRGERNPIQHLYTPRYDGYFESGNGGHTPTTVIRIAITEAQFDAMRDLVEKKRYPFSRYSLCDAQCTIFVVKLASLANLVLEHEVTMPVPQNIRFDGVDLRLWSDREYSTLTISTPDRLEESMLQAVREGKAIHLTE